GAGIDVSTFYNTDRRQLKVLRQHFNAVSPTFCMKIPQIAGQYGEGKTATVNFEAADQFVKFARLNNLKIMGHCLINGVLIPKGFFFDTQGNAVSAEVLLETIKTHIDSLAGRYKGKIHSWDAANEILDNQGNYLKNLYYNTLGEDYVKYIFQFARQADSEARLYYTDTNLSYPAKREGALRMLKKLQAEGLKIDGVGFHGHTRIGKTNFAELEKSIIAFSELGLKVSVTEMDVSVLHIINPDLDTDTLCNPDFWETLNPYSKSLPKIIAKRLYEDYKTLFRIFIKHSDKIERVTLWGISDSESIQNNYPIRGRTDYPLLFDRDYQAKPVVKELINMGKSIK
ncbi:MAG: endo-1,4-beta-xylanase, partial [Paludibacter sp.]|nr:endo-1,4-beta-xylanase [Paludibacter sp.]